VQYCGQPQGEHAGGEGGTDRRGQIDDALLAAGYRPIAGIGGPEGGSQRR
jgi:hypothetical protein